MPYVTSIERLVFEKGRRQGRREGLREGLQQGLEEGARKELVAVIMDALEMRFGVEGKRLVRRIRAITALDTLRSLNGVAWTASTLECVKAQFPILMTAAEKRVVKTQADLARLLSELPHRSWVCW
jgi:hypothetical protein